MNLGFENISRTYDNALTNLSYKTGAFYMKAPIDLSKILVDAVSELWHKQAEAIKLLEQT